MKLLALLQYLPLPITAQVNSWFPPEQLMTIGVYYYPEAWPESQWERDIANIKKLGFEYIHMSEFAWAFMEPEEGRYDFTWLDKSVALAQKYGLKVVLCTPTATPPAWLSRNHPEILMVRGDGTRMNHGSRRTGGLELAGLPEIRREHHFENGRTVRVEPHCVGLAA